MAKVWDDINEFATFLEKVRKVSSPIVATSGGFDPLHIGHLRCIQESRYFGNFVVVIVNGDGFLQRKKGYSFMPEKERMEIIAGLLAVDHVVSFDDGSQYVAGALALIKPNVFTKGGDRSTPESISQFERDVCEKINCRIEYAVGGKKKIQSSSKLAEKAIANAHSKT